MSYRKMGTHMHVWRMGGTAKDFLSSLCELLIRNGAFLFASKTKGGNRAMVIAVELRNIRFR